MIKTSEYKEFRFHKLYTFWRKGESPPSLKIYAFPSDRALCVVAALDCYIEGTSIWRENQASQLLASFIKSHNAVAKSTDAGWVKQIPIMSGINTDIFKPHSNSLSILITCKALWFIIIRYP